MFGVGDAPRDAQALAAVDVISGLLDGGMRVRGGGGWGGWVRVFVQIGRAHV